MKKEHRGVLYNVRRIDDGRWEWAVYPKMGEGVHFDGIEDDEQNATAKAKAEIDRRLGKTKGPKRR